MNRISKFSLILISPLLLSSCSMVRETFNSLFNKNTVINIKTYEPVQNGYYVHSKNVPLQVSTTGHDDGFSTELKTKDIINNAHEGKNGSNFSPNTGWGRFYNDGFKWDSNMHGHPVYQYFGYDNWPNPLPNSYLEFDLYFRQPKNYGEKVFLNEINLKILNSKKGISKDKYLNAFRVQFTIYGNDADGNEDSMPLIISNEKREELPLGGKLDLNGDGEYDRSASYEWSDDLEIVEYGDSSIIQNTTSFKEHIDGPVIPQYYFSNIYGDCHRLEVRVWLEGWDDPSIWTENFQPKIQLDLGFYLS